jgi:hypothetical protein
MGDPDRDASMLGQPERVTAVVMNVTVYNVVGTVLSENAQKVLGVSQWSGMAQAG